MSGSGSSRGEIRGKYIKQETCNLSFETNLYGPVPDVVSTLRVGDHLYVKLTEDQLSVGVFKKAQSEPVGTIVGPVQIPDLIACLQDGHAYGAAIRQIVGSTVTIKVYRISKL